MDLDRFSHGSRHFFQILDQYREALRQKKNFADVIWNQEGEFLPHSQHIPALSRELLYRDLGYCYRSFNLHDSAPPWSFLYQKLTKIILFDTVIFYYDPLGGVFPLNPFNKRQWKQIDSFEPRSLIVVSAKGFLDKSEEPARKYLRIVEELFCNELAVDDPDYAFLVRESGKLRENAQETQIEANREASHSNSIPQSILQHRRKSTQYRILVTNELFHNGNVEAWKNIIESYRKKYPACRVEIYFEGERINNIQALFKWGKVKLGNVIFFSVIGHQVENVAKLKHYLHQGASPGFECFLKKLPETSLNLF